ncbi:MAG: transglutaminase-like domain-containing protein [Pirellulaceae bacterium]
MARADDTSRLDPDLAYLARRSDPVTYDVDFSVVVTAPYHTETLKVWLPIPQSDAAQIVISKDISTFPMGVSPRIGTEKKFGNKFAYFEFSRPEGAQMIRHRFQVKVWELHWDINPSNIVAVEKWPESFAPYLASESQAVVLNDGMNRLLSEIVPQRTRSYQDIASVLQWVDSHFTYDHVQASLQASSLHAFERQRGHCSDYHGFCAAMGRAIGYPTRVTYGINPFPKNSPSHCKLEVFLPPYGWVSFDVSETQKLAASIRKNEDLTPAEKQALIAAASQRLLSGFRDNTWFLQTRGTDYELEPPAARRAAVVRTIYAEADGEPLPEPDPSAKGQKEFSWMTIHKYQADRTVTYPFKDLRTLSISGTGVRAAEPAESR